MNFLLKKVVFFLLLGVAAAISRRQINSRKFECHSFKKMHAHLTLELLNKSEQKSGYPKISPRRIDNFVRAFSASLQFYD